MWKGPSYFINNVQQQSWERKAVQPWQGTLALKQGHWLLTLTISFFPFSFHHFAHNCILSDFKVYYEFMLQRGCVMALETILGQRRVILFLMTQDIMRDKRFKLSPWKYRYSWISIETGGTAHYHLFYPRLAMRTKVQDWQTLLPEKFQGPSRHKNSQLRICQGASLVVQWLRICLPMQGIQVRALVWEDPTCRGATRPKSHNYWACTSGACAPQQKRPR